MQSEAFFTAKNALEDLEQELYHAETISGHTANPRTLLEFRTKHYQILDLKLHLRAIAIEYPGMFVGPDTDDICPICFLDKVCSVFGKKCSQCGKRICTTCAAAIDYSKCPLCRMTNPYTRYTYEIQRPPPIRSVITHKKGLFSIETALLCALFVVYSLLLLHTLMQRDRIYNPRHSHADNTRTHLLWLVCMLEETTMYTYSAFIATPVALEADPHDYSVSQHILAAIILLNSTIIPMLTKFALIHIPDGVVLTIAQVLFLKP